MAGRHLPFRVGVDFDANEGENSAGSGNMATLN